MGNVTFEEIARLVMSGEMSQEQGAAALGVGRTTFVYRLNKAYPNRERGVMIKQEKRIRAGGRPHIYTYLERAYTDETLCQDLACTRCPLFRPDGTCPGPEGLIRAMLEKGPKRHPETLEENV